MDVHPRKEWYFTDQQTRRDRGRGGDVYGVGWASETPETEPQRSMVFRGLV